MCIYSLNLASSASLHLPAIVCICFGKTKFSDNPLERNPRTACFIMPDVLGIYSDEGNMREERGTSDWPHAHDQDSVTLKTRTSRVELLFFPPVRIKHLVCCSDLHTFLTTTLIHKLNFINYSWL